MPTAVEAGPIRRVLVATDRSESADRAVQWAANLAESHGAELILFQVLLPAADGAAPDDERQRLARAEADLRRFAQELAGVRGRGRVVVHEDPSLAILDGIDAERADVVVVGNVGMSGRRQFLLGNIPNRVSHNAPCTVVIVNTAGAGQQASGWRAAGGTEQRERRLSGRAWQIGRVLARAGLRELLRRTPGSPGSDDEALRARARRLREALDQLGPTFAKLGQILSTRPDLLPQPIIDELAALQEHVTPLSEAEVVAAMERELGVPWEDVFASIEPQPLAAGTIAQVHRATLETGERVVVKVQRPSAEQDILQDLRLLELFAERTRRRPALTRVFDLPAMIEHLAGSLRRELDFRQEAANLRRMAEVLKPFSRLGVPAVYEDYSTARLLVMQEIQGVPVRQAPLGPARTEAARQLLEAYYSQVMSEGFFHADPHPGNMKWWNDRIYFLDLGMVGEVEPEVRELILLLLLAFAQEDAAFLAETVLQLAGSPQGEATDLAAFREELAGLIARYRNLSLREIQLGPLLQEVTAIAVRNNVRVPASLALTGKAFAQMQLVAADLDPTLDPFAVAQAFVLRRFVKQVTGSLDPRKVFYEAQKTRQRVLRLIEAVEMATGARPGGTLQVGFRSEGLEASIGRLGDRLALGLGLGGALVATAMTANSRRLPPWVPATLGGLGAALGTRLLVGERRRSR